MYCNIEIQLLPNDIDYMIEK